MPLKDVTVTIDIKKASRLTGLGKPLILARFAGPSTFKNYAEPEDVAVAYGVDTPVHKIAKTLLKQGETSPATLAVATYDPAPQAPAVAMTAAQALEKYFDEDFYFVTADTQVATEVKAIADVVEGEGIKLFGTTVTTMEDLAILEAGKYDRTFAVYHETPGEYPAEALIGGHGSKTVGSVTYFNKRVMGITPQPFNAAKISEIEALNAFAIVVKSNTIVSSEGTVLSGEYIDVMHAKDWMTFNITNSAQEVFIKNDKVGFSDGGISLLYGAVKNVMTAGVDNRIILVDEGIPVYTIRTVPRSQTNPADRAARVYNGLTFSFEIEGAIHKAPIKGELIV